MKKNFLLLVGFAAVVMSVGCNDGSAAPDKLSYQDTLGYPDEKNLKNIQQLTFGGDNAEGYFSYDGKKIVFQRTAPEAGIECDQIFVGDIPELGQPFEYKMVSTGKGRTTCAFFTKDNQHIIYASTHLAGESCPPPVDREKYGNRYIWPLYSGYDIFMADLEGNIVKQLTNSEGYDAEATLSPDGKLMVYTSVKNGDLDLYVMNLETGEEKQVTTELGYDGGAWFSPDGTKLIWRASRPSTPEEIKEYKELLKEGLVAPTNMEVFVADIDGKNQIQISKLGKANWAPNFMPDSKRIIFASNHEYERGFPFNIYTMNGDGSNLTKVSRDKGFDAFPMFSYDGKKIAFSSNRNNGGTRETNLFIADWVE